MSEAFDLDSVDPRPRAQDGVDMELLDPSGAPTGVILVVRGYDSAIYRETVERHLRRRVELGRKLTEAEQDAEFLEECGVLLAGWKGKPLQRGGQPLAYSPAHAEQLLKDYAYILEQVRRFAGNRRNFLPGSATS